MPKKKMSETQAEQSKRFLKKVAELEAAGELNPTEADESFERAVNRIVGARSTASDEQED